MKNTSKPFEKNVKQDMKTRFQTKSSCIISQIQPDVLLFWILGHEQMGKLT